MHNTPFRPHNTYAVSTPVRLDVYRTIDIKQLGQMVQTVFSRFRNEDRQLAVLQDDFGFGPFTGHALNPHYFPPSLFLNCRLRS
ncbi:hypothetical protein D3C80_1282880 [compost metagenome]